MEPAVKTFAAASLMLAGLALAPQAAAEPPSFNYAQVTGQHYNFGSSDGWGWDLAGSFNPVGGWFVSGNAQRFSDYLDLGDSLSRYRADIGYKFDLAATLSLYGKAGWARQSFGPLSDDGLHAEVGVRARLPFLQLEGSVGHFQRNGGFNQYAATALFHVFPMTYITVGYISDRWSSRHENRWQAGLRLSF